MKATTRSRPHRNPADRRLPTITFQPTDAASAVIAAVINDRTNRKPAASRRIRSALINEALLVHFSDYLTAGKSVVRKN